MVQEFKAGVRKIGTPNIAVVAQTGFIDLRVSLTSGSVPSSLEGVEGNFNGIDDPSSIVGKPEDVFQALRAKETLNEVSKDAKQAAPSEVSPEEGEGA